MRTYEPWGDTRRGNTETGKITVVMAAKMFYDEEIDARETEERFYVDLLAAVDRGKNGDAA